MLLLQLYFSQIGITLLQGNILIIKLYSLSTVTIKCP